MTNGLTIISDLKEVYVVMTMFLRLIQLLF